VACVTVQNHVAKYISVKFYKFNYNNLFFSNDLLNNRLKINRCVEKYYGKMVALNSEGSQKFTCFNILHYAASAITRDFIFVKMRASIIIPCRFLARAF